MLSVELKHKLPVLTPKTELMTRITPEFASRDYMDFFYGVEPAFATVRSGCLPCQVRLPGDTTVVCAETRIQPDTVEFRSGLKFGFYNGAANDNSPLFTDKATNGFFAAVLWKFWESERRANR